MIYKINKNIILENSAEFSAMLRQQTISGNSLGAQDYHRTALMQDGKDIETEVEHVRNKITNDALHIDNLKERQALIDRQSRGIRY